MSQVKQDCSFTLRVEFKSVEAITSFFNAIKPVLNTSSNLIEVCEIFVTSTNTHVADVRVNDCLTVGAYISFIQALNANIIDPVTFY